MSQDYGGDDVEEWFETFRLPEELRETLRKDYEPTSVEDIKYLFQDGDDSIKELSSKLGMESMLSFFYAIQRTTVLRGVITVDTLLESWWKSIISPFDGNDLNGWMEHFLLPIKLRENLSSIDVIGVTDLQVVISDKELQRKAVEGLSTAEIGYFCRVLRLTTQLQLYESVGSMELHGDDAMATDHSHFPTEIWMNLFNLPEVLRDNLQTLRVVNFSSLITVLNSADDCRRALTGLTIGQINSLKESVVNTEGLQGFIDLDSPTFLEGVPEPTRFDGSEFLGWMDHFRLPMRLRENLESINVQSIGDLQFVIANPQYFPEDVLTGLSHAERKYFDNVVDLTTLLQRNEDFSPALLASVGIRTTSNGDDDAQLWAERFNLSKVLRNNLESLEVRTVPDLSFVVSDKDNRETALQGLSTADIDRFYYAICMTKRFRHDEAVTSVVRRTAFAHFKYFGSDDINAWINHFELPEVLWNNLQRLNLTSVRTLGAIFEEEGIESEAMDDDEDAEENRFQVLSQALSSDELKKVKTTIYYTESLRSYMSTHRNDLVAANKAALKALAKTLDIVFMIDCSLSMGKYIKEIYANIVSFLNEVGSYDRSYSIKIGAVAYRDKSEGEMRTQLFDLTEDLEDFEYFIRRLRTFGGGDVAEDVLEGLDVVCSNDFTWRSGLRLLFHIGDAPCHGSRFHNLKPEEDSMHDAEECNRRAESVLGRLREKKLHYHFLRIDPRTNKMIEEFNKIYTNDPSGNAVPIAVTDIIDTSPAQPVRGILNGRLVKALRKITSTLLPSWEVSMTMHDEQDATAEMIQQSREEPTWEKILPERVDVYSLSLPRSIDELLKSDSNRCVLPCASSNLVTLQLAPQPFKVGRDMLNIRGRFHLSTADSSNNVFPVLMTERLLLYRDMMSRVAVESSLARHRTATSLALAFNCGRPEDRPCIRFSKVLLVQLTERSANAKPYLICEECLETTVEQYNNDNGFVEPNPTVPPNPTVQPTDHSVVQAFSHWTYEITDGDLLVVNCKGCYNQRSKTFTLRDPTIHCTNRSLYGTTNLAEEGMILFFRTHICNEYCKQLGLKHPYFK